MTFKFGIHAEFALGNTTELFAGYRQEFTDFEDDTEATSTGLIFGENFILIIDLGRSLLSPKCQY